MNPIFLLCALLVADDGLPERPEIAMQDKQVIVAVETAASTGFHRALIRSALKASKEGKLQRRDVVKLRVAMMSPAFRERAEDLAVVQMSASGEGDVPMTEDGTIDRAGINWDGLASFLERLLPLILELLKAFGTLA